MRERWLPVVGFEGLYEVSDQGRVRSLGRIDSLGRSWPRKIMTPGNGGRGYAKVDFRKDGRYWPVYVHVAVLAAFVGERPAKHEGAHNNGLLRDNRLSNLAWKTHGDNEADKLAHGTRLRGTSHPNARLTRSDVVRIRATDAPAGELAFEHGVTENHIRAIRRHRYWQHV